jgi:hypothetical protein
MVEISVIIPTYNRPVYLPRAIASCVAQRVDAAFEIIIVDNNPEGSARAQVAEIAQTSAIPICYVHEQRPGISHARNTGVAASSARYIVFLDDDEEADPGWLAAHRATMRRFAADIVFGAVHASFPPSARVDPYPRNKFSRHAGVPTGEAPPRLPGIGNTMLDRERCFTEPEPFDPWLGLTGGEDTVFLRKLLRRGCKMVWCAEAGVRENVPADRLAPRFLLRRAFQRGQVTTFSCTAVDPPYRAQAVRMMIAGCAQVLLFGPTALVLRLVNHPRWLALMDRAAQGLGKILWHPAWQRRLYR